MANYVYIAASLDGFIATPEGGIEWLADAPNPDAGDFGFSKFLSRVHAILMGRVTFEKVLEFDQWPYDIPVFIISKTLKTVPPRLEGKVKILHGPLARMIEQLNARGFYHFYIDGGRLIQSFLSEDLIDEIIITRFPKLLGRGIPLFGDLSYAMDFTHIETEVIENYLVKSRYRRERIKLQSR